MRRSRWGLWPAASLATVLLPLGAVGGAEPSEPAPFALSSVDESLVCYGAYSNVALGASGTLDQLFCGGATSTHYGVDGIRSPDYWWWATWTCGLHAGHYIEYDLGATYELGGTGVQLYTVSHPTYAAYFQNIMVQFFEGPTLVWNSNLVFYNPSNPSAAIVLPAPPVRADRVRIVKTAMAGGSWHFPLAEVEVDGRPCTDAAAVPALTGSAFAFLCAWLLGLGFAALALGSAFGRTRT